MFDVPAGLRFHLAATLLIISLAFALMSYYTHVSALAMCAGICLASACRIAYSIFREQGVLGL